MAHKTNHEQLFELGASALADVMLNIAEDFCAVCPRNIKRNCNENCRAGITEWLHGPYIAGSCIWKRRTK